MGPGSPAGPSRKTAFGLGNRRFGTGSRPGSLSPGSAFRPVQIRFAFSFSSNSLFSASIGVMLTTSRSATSCTSLIG